MTEQRATYLKRTQHLPSPVGLDLLVVWANEGPHRLVPPSSTVSQAHYTARTNAVRALRRLAVTLEVPGEQCTELEPVHGREFADLSDGLLNALAWRARERGHLMPGGTARTPLTPIQADTLYRTAYGATGEDIAYDTATTGAGALGHLARMRRRHGCSTTAHLVATAYRHGWLPDAGELRVLLTGRMVWSMPVPHYGPTDKPPFRWTEEA